MTKTPESVSFGEPIDSALELTSGARFYKCALQVNPYEYLSRHGACVAVALNGETFYHFWLALILLGFGWNFMFVGGTTLVTRVHSVSERAKTQGLSEFLTFGTNAVASLSSGWPITRRTAQPAIT